jgi:hypothetical protein
MPPIAIGFLIAGLADPTSSAPARVDLRLKLTPGEVLTVRSRTDFALSLRVERLSVKGALPAMVGDSSRTVRLTPERPDDRGRQPVREQIVRRESVVSWTVYDLPPLRYVHPEPGPRAGADLHPSLIELAKGLRTLDGANLTYHFGENGDIALVRAAPEVPEHFETGILKQFLERPGGLTLKRSRVEEFKQWLGVLPGRPVEEGDTWDRVELVAIEPLLFATGQVFSVTKVYEYAGTVRQGSRTLDKIVGTVKAVRYAPVAAPHRFLVQDSAEEVASADLRPLASEQTILFDRGLGRQVSSRGALKIDGRLKVRIHRIGDNVLESAGHLTLSIRFEEALED